MRPTEWSVTMATKSRLVAIDRSYRIWRMDDSNIFIHIGEHLGTQPSASDWNKTAPGEKTNCLV